MKIYILEILENGDYGENDFVLGAYSSRALAESAFEKYCEAMDSFITEEEENPVKYIETHSSYIKEEELDNMEF